MPTPLTFLPYPSWPRQFPPPGPPADARKDGAGAKQSVRQHQPARPDAHAVPGRPFRLRVRPSTRQLRPGPSAKLLVPGPLDGWGTRGARCPAGPFFSWIISFISFPNSVWERKPRILLFEPLAKNRITGCKLPGNGVSHAPAASAHHFGGQIAAFTLLRRALSDSEIRQLYLARPDFSTTMFEEGSKPWPIQTRGQAGYRAPQEPATMPISRAHFSQPVALRRPP